ncbi:MAG TPA: hypothetical protein VGF08_12555 [Terriglobales bacterium]|jgi:hypothetical protein
MATGGLSTGMEPVAPANDLAAQKARAQQIVGAGAGWFIWIAGLSVVNSVIGMAGGGVHFIVGLGITQEVDALAKEAGSSGMVLDLIINGFVVGVFALFWHFARKGQSWAFIVGMLLYAADGLLLLVFKDIFSVAFHAYALFRIYNGFKVLPILQKLEQAMAPAGAPIVPR